MSDTPRTDAAEFFADVSTTKTEVCVLADFARELERELAQAPLADLVCTLSVDDFRAIHYVLTMALDDEMEQDDYQALRKVWLRVESEIDRVDMLRIQRAKGRP